MEYQNPLKNEKGIAMVLALTLVVLLSALGLFLITDSETAFRISKSETRHVKTLNLAEGAVYLALRAIRDDPPEVTKEQLLANTKLEMKYDPSATTADVDLNQQIDFGSDASQGMYTPEIYFIGWSPDPLPGFDLSLQDKPFITVYYQARGEGEIPLGGLGKSCAAMTGVVGRAVAD